MDYIKIAKDAIKLQSSYLLDMERSLGDEFNKAVKAILETKGRVVLCGIGKSGIVARKISSIFSSVGCSSFFVHGNEASHGDLGAIRNEDLVIVLSNSGETKELVDVLSYCRNSNITIMAIVGRMESTLYDSSDISLVLPRFSEISDNIKFPTTSATLMSVMGDALALCVVRAKNVSVDQYKSFHPGGNIGNSLIKISEIMRKGDEVPVVKVGTKVVESLIEMTKKSIGCVIIEQGSDVVGIITEGDLRRNINKNFSECEVQDIMSKSPKSILENLLAIDALQYMSDKEVMQLLVRSAEGKIVGVIHMHDCLRVGLKAQCD